MITRRPSIKGEILHKFGEIASAGELKRTLREQARHLQAWVREEFPEHADIQFETIEGHIRRAYKDIRRGG
jgi:hypothetical protein